MNIPDPKRGLIVLPALPDIQLGARVARADGESEGDDMSSMTDEEGGAFTTTIEYADKTVAVLQSQLRDAGMRPIDYIPLHALQAEITTIMASLNAGESYDQVRLDYLLECLTLNPEYKKQQDDENRQWRDEILPYCDDCVELMRGYVSHYVFCMFACVHG